MGIGKVTKLRVGQFHSKRNHNVAEILFVYFAESEKWNVLYRCDKGYKNET
jgi:hypothetical protein